MTRQREPALSKKRCRVPLYDELLAEAWARLKAEEAQREAEKAAKRRVVCSAKTRKGTPCKNMSEPGKRRCKFHGGRSTGPKTAEGRERIAQAQRQRWAEYRSKDDHDELGESIINWGPSLL